MALEHEVKQLELKAKVEHQLSFEEGKLEVLEREEGKERGEVEEVKEAIAKLHNHHEVASNELADEHEDKIEKATVAHKTHRANVRDAHAAFMNKHHPWSTVRFLCLPFFLVPFLGWNLTVLFSQSVQ